MTIKQILTFAVALLVNLLLESVIFVRFGILGIRPDSIIPVIIAMSLVSGSAKGTIYGFAIGMLLDVLFSRYLGMYAVGYVFIGLLAGFFSDKYFAHNPIFVALLTLFAYFAKEGIFALQLIIMRFEFTVGTAFWRYFLPSAMLTTIVSIPVYYIYKKDRKIEMRRSRWDSSSGYYDRRKTK